MKKNSVILLALLLNTSLALAADSAPAYLEKTGGAGLFYRFAINS
jgi:hypothetical protein